MWKPTILIALLAAAFVFGRARGAQGAETPARQDDRKAIEKLEHEWLDHISDRATLERVLADDFEHPVAAGIFLTKAQHIDWAVGHPRAAGRRASFASLKVRLYGESAVASGIVEETGSSGPVKRTIFTDVFVRRNGAWQAVSACENRIAPGP